MNSLPPPYGHGAVYGISTQVDERITGQEPSPYLNSCARTSHLMDMATTHKPKLAPLAETRGALQQVFCSRERGWPASKRLRGALTTLPAAIAHDLVKPLYYLSRMAVASSRSKYERKRLQREHCSGIARLHFDQIHNLKDDLISAGLPPTQTLPNAAAAIEEWLRRALQALKGSFVDRNENRLFCHVVQRLRKSRDGMYGLILPSSKD